MVQFAFFRGSGRSPGHHPNLILSWKTAYFTLSLLEQLLTNSHPNYLSKVKAIWERCSLLPIFCPSDDAIKCSMYYLLSSMSLAVYLSVCLCLSGRLSVSVSQSVCLCQYVSLCHCLSRWMSFSLCLTVSLCFFLSFF